jgi:integrase
MEGMARPRPQFLRREKTRHGKLVWYVRRGDGPRIRIDAEFGTPEFAAAYEAAIAQAPVPAREPPVRTGSIKWLLERYRDSMAWADLSPATRRQRENIFVHVIEKVGHEQCSSLNRKSVEAAKDARRATPAQARNFLDAMKGLCRWAFEAGLMTSDPTMGVKNPKRSAGPGFPVWSEDDVSRYEARWKPGTRQRVWLHVLLYTGLRRGDAVRIGRQHVRDGVATIKTEKTDTEVSLPLLAPLLETLAHGPTGDLAFICGERGQPLTKESFGNLFRAACKEAGVEKSAHGVRKIGATRAAENGATVAELDAIFAWSGGQMASLYTRAADRRRLAKSGMDKLSRTTEQHPIAEPVRNLRRTGEKD